MSHSLETRFRVDGFEVWRRDMVRLYRCTPTVDKPLRVPVLLAYALAFVGGKAQKILAPSIATWLRERS